MPSCLDPLSGDKKETFKNDNVGPKTCFERRVPKDGEVAPTSCRYTLGTAGRLVSFQSIAVTEHDPIDVFSNLL